MLEFPWNFYCTCIVMTLTKTFLLLAAFGAVKAPAAIPSSLKEMIKANPPLNIRLCNEGLGSYTVSWDGNITFADNVYYQLSYKYLNAIDDKTEPIILQKYQRTMDLELHRGLFIQVKLLYSAEYVDEISSNWTKRTFDQPRDSFASVENLTCVFYGNTYMNCTWDVYDDATEDAQFILSYRMQDASVIYNCSNYRVDGTKNTGCIGHRYDLPLFLVITMCISELTNKTKLPYCRIFGPYKFHKLGSPINVKINKSTDEVTWNLANDNLNPICYDVQLKITDWNNGEQKVKNTSDTKYVISRDKTKKYSVQVRVKVNNFCLESIIWSDWSKPLIIASDASDMSVLAIASVFAVILVVLILLLVFICIKCKFVSKMCQPIPDAGEKFKGLFEEYNGDFQKWINKNPQLANKTEECT
ncbi:interleukin-5 receptor subunit alpha-like [Hypanus sabinus]|uniref:interleukin-5 receptor subunit alpha-like n=1 Tax=Hypanus sabinus TaxID=79690 RepID=UPI0028C3B9C5|nr:interleukin-5 receptor subunit alpha-like [Hypanus sabinus]